MTAMQEQHEPEVGAIPAGWSIAALGDLGSCIRGVSYKPEHLMQRTGEGVTTLLRSNNIKNDRVNFDDVQFVAGCKISENQLARPFDIAICMSNGSKALVGKSGVVTPAHLARHPRLTVGAFCAIYRSPVRYTAQIFKSQFFQSAIDVQLAGSAINNLKGSDIEGIRFPLPPREEQQGIAAILTAVDDKLDVIARQIEAIQTLKQGLMQTLFSRGVGTQDADGRWVPHAELKPSALGMVPASWVVEPLDRYVSKVGSGVTPKGGSTSYQSSGIPLIRSQNVLVGRLSLDDVAYIDEVQHNKMRNSALEPEDVLLNITGASIGRCAVLPLDFSEGNVNQHVCIIRTLPSLNPQFLCQYINSSFGQKQVAKFQAGGNREGLNYQQVRSFDVPVPSVAEQEKIADLLEAVDGKVRCLERKQLQHQTLKSGLMQKLLTGEWRVKVDANMAA